MNNEQWTMINEKWKMTNEKLTLIYDEKKMNNE